MNFELSLGTNPLGIELREPASPGAALVIAISGEIDRANCAEVTRAVTQTIQAKAPEYISLDLDQVTFLDSAGIRTLLICRDNARQHGSELDIGRAHPHVLQVLTITGLLEEFNLPPTT